ncbi:MAG TPA: putative porin [Vicinamibacterales bacterium]|nr:putative porin [Vicinamibacterales bacterium]
MPGSSARSILCAACSTFLFLASGATAALAQAPPAAPKPWWERIALSGDLRARFEGFFRDGRGERYRQRYRLRLALSAPVHDDVTVGFRLASGDPTDIASTNQTLTGLLSRKPITIDQVYVRYRPAALRVLTLGYGKFGYPVTTTQMVWDDDVNWEGAYQQVAWTRGAGSFTLVAAQAPLVERPRGADAYLLVWYGQAGVQIGAHRVQGSAANYRFLRPDLLAVAVDTEGLSNPITNRVTRGPDGRVAGYQSGYNLVDVIVRAVLATRRPDYPVTLVGDWVTNTRAVAGRGGGLWLSAAYGLAARPRRYAVGYTYARIEQDAVLSTFNFSDMFPHTNVRAHIASASIMPLARVNLDVTGIVTRPIEPVPGLSDERLTRLQVDMRFAF